MTELETAVADALVHAMDGMTLAQGYNMSPNDHIRRLAPRIAAAIERAAGIPDSAEMVSSDKFPLIAVALAALRGRDGSLK